MHVIVIVVWATHALCTCLLACRIDSLKGEILGHSVRRGCRIGGLSWWQDRLEGADVLWRHGCAILTA